MTSFLLITSGVDDVDCGVFSGQQTLARCARLC